MGVLTGQKSANAIDNSAAAAIISPVPGRGTVPGAPPASEGPYVNLGGPPADPAYRLQAAVEQFVRTDVEPAASRIDESGEFPVTLLKRAGEHGVRGVTVP